MPRPSPATSSSDSDSNSEQSIIDEVEVIVGDLYSSDVIQHLERPRLLSFSNTFDDLELKCLCRKGKCRYSWPRVSERPIYPYQIQDIGSSSVTELSQPTKDTKPGNRKQNIVLSTIRSIVSSASGRKSGKSVKEVAANNINTPDNFDKVAEEPNSWDVESDSESASATCDLTISFQSYLDTLKSANTNNDEMTSSSSTSSDSDVYSTDNYSEEEFRRIAEIGRAANFTELELVDVVTPSPKVRLVWVGDHVSSSFTIAATTPIPQSHNIPSKSTGAITESTTKQPSSKKTKRKKRLKTPLLPKALNLKINKPKFFKTRKNERISSESGQSKDSHNYNTPDKKTIESTSGSTLPISTSSTVTSPTKPNLKTENDHSFTGSSKQATEQLSSEHEQHAIKDDNQKDTNIDKNELFIAGASNIHDFLVHGSTSSGPPSRQKSSSVSSDDSDSTASEVEEDEVRSIAHDLRSLHIISIDNPIRLIGFGRLDEDKCSVAKQSYYSESKRSKRLQNYKLSNVYKVDNGKEKHLCDDRMSHRPCGHASGDNSDVDTSDSEEGDGEDGWRAVYDFTKPAHRNFTPEWSSDTSTDPNTSDNSDIFSSDDDNLDFNYSYSVLQLKRSEGLTGSEKLRESAPVKLIGFNSLV